MVKRILVTGLVLVALMAAIKDGRVLRDAGLTGSCSVVQQTADGTQLEACRGGKLEGMPDLSRNGCTVVGTAAGREYWKCPAPVVASPSR
jgi:hypothetical protein